MHIKSVVLIAFVAVFLLLLVCGTSYSQEVQPRKSDTAVFIELHENKSWDRIWSELYLVSSSSDELDLTRQDFGYFYRVRDIYGMAFEKIEPSPVSGTENTIVLISLMSASRNWSLDYIASAFREMEDIGREFGTIVGYKNQDNGSVNFGNE